LFGPKFILKILEFISAEALDFLDDFLLKNRKKITSKDFY